MMMTTPTEGKCVFCNGTFSASVVGRHVESCDKRKSLLLQHQKSANSVPQSSSSMHLLIKGSNGLSMYWMHLEGDSNAKLRDLDAFLRGIWVECCGHLSMFEIEDETYSVEPQKGYDDRSMNVKLGSVLRDGTKFSYEYDFGTTTSLDLKVVSTHHPSWLSGKFELLARNDQPAIQCGACGKETATNVCSDCISEDEKGWLCDDCSEKHECGEEMLLPVVNSPRVGMCGYTG